MGGGGGGGERGVRGGWGRGGGSRKQGRGNGEKKVMTGVRWSEELKGWGKGARVGVKSG